MSKRSDNYQVFLYGWSMRRVFEPGDVLHCEPIAFEDIRPGDIISIDPKDGSRPYVHRVIQIFPDKIITQGDNNPGPDKRFLTRNCSYAIVRTVSRKKKPHAPDETVPGGKQGMRIFHRNQLRRRFRLKFSSFVRSLDCIAFWRIPCTEQAYFGTMLWFYHKNRPIAKIVREKVVFLHWYDKLIYKVVFLPENQLKQQNGTKHGSEQNESD